MKQYTLICHRQNIFTIYKENLYVSQAQQHMEGSLIKWYAEDDTGLEQDWLKHPGSTMNQI